MTAVRKSAVRSSRFDAVRSSVHGAVHRRDRTGGGQDTRDRGDDTASRRHDTAARRAIAAAVAGERRSFTARELYERLRASHPVGLTTVYRTLALLLGDGAVREAGRRRSETLYATCELTGHHHHLICDACGVVVGSDVCQCGVLESDLSARHGFVLRASESNYHGLCAACAARGEAS